MPKLKQGIERKARIHAHSALARITLNFFLFLSAPSTKVSAGTGKANCTDHVGPFSFSSLSSNKKISSFGMDEYPNDMKRIIQLKNMLYESKAKKNGRVISYLIVMSFRLTPRVGVR